MRTKIMKCLVHKGINTAESSSAFPSLGRGGWTSFTHEAELPGRFGADTAVNWPGDAVILEVDLQVGKSQNLIVVDCGILEKQHGTRDDKTEAKVDQR